MYLHRFASAYAQHAANSHPSGDVLTLITDIQSHILAISQHALLLVNRAYFVGAAMLTDDVCTVWFNNQPYHALPVALNTVHNALLHARLGSANYSIAVTSAPLPYVDDTRVEQVAIAGQLGFALALNITYAMAFTMAFYVLPIVRERANRAQLLQFVSGAKVLIYWATAFVFDYATFVMGCVLLLVVFAAFQVGELCSFRGSSETTRQP